MSNKLTYANTMATVAVFVALGGASYAAVVLPRNSVGSKQLKSSAVTSPKVKDGSLQAADFAPGQLPAGTKGAAGAAGPKGDTGAKGDAGAAGAPGQAGGFPATLPAGHTETGTYAGEDVTSSGSGRVLAEISFAVPLSTAPTPQLVTPGATTPQCTGTVLVPTAAAGALCVYEGLNSSSPSVFPPDGGSLGTAGPTGAILSVIGGPDAFAYGSWAVTA